jgi:hypothetical protein
LDLFSPELSCTNTANLHLLCHRLATLSISSLVFIPYN